MKKKKSFYDIVAAFAFVFNVDWDKEYETYEVDDLFFDNSDWRSKESDSTSSNLPQAEMKVI